MRFDRNFLLSLAALSSYAFSVDAFMTRHGTSNGLTTTFGANSNVKLLQPTRGFNTQLYAADDDDDDYDDDDDDDEDEGPLAKGVDSVSWLPTVAGGEGEDISGVREVRLFRPFLRPVKLETNYVCA
jgi:hypothetical protein